jgi:hypothetical protein
MITEKIQPPKHVSHPRLRRAACVRELAWEESITLIHQRRLGAAYRHMVNACHRAWRIECCIDP